MSRKARRVQVRKWRSFEQFYEAHVDEVYGFLRVRSNAHLAEELTAEVFVSAFERWDEHDNLKPGWLMTVARRRLIDEWRRSTRNHDRFEAMIPFTPQSTPSPQNETETRTLVLHALDRLPNTQRQALILRYLDDLSVGGVAHVLHRTYSSTESLLSRARRNFENLYDEGSYVLEPVEARPQRHALAVSS